MTSRRCSRRARSCTSSRGTTTRRRTRTIPIPISGWAGATAPSTRWATPGSTSPTTTTRTSRSRRTSARRRPRRTPREPGNNSRHAQAGSFDPARNSHYNSGRRLRTAPFSFQPRRSGMRRSFVVAVLISALAGGVLVRAGQQGVGQVPSPLPLTQTVRDRGSSVTPAFEGWYYDKDGSQRFLVGYFNRNMKQEFDIPVGPNNHIDPGGPDQGQPTHFQSGRQWGIVSIKVPKDLGDKKLTWTIVANGFTNSITLHTKADYIVEPFEDAASKNTPPKIKFAENGPIFTGPPTVNAETLTATTGAPLTLTTWVTDEGPKINVPENPGRGRGAR